MATCMWCRKDTRGVPVVEACKSTHSKVAQDAYKAAGVKNLAEIIQQNLRISTDSYLARHYKKYPLMIRLKLWRHNAWVWLGTPRTGLQKAALLLLFILGVVEALLWYASKTVVK